MIILININNFDDNYLFFQEPIHNTIINNSYFIRIIYSNNSLICNSINFRIDLTKENSNYNYDIIKKISNIEKIILNSYNNTYNNYTYKINDYLNNILFKFINSDNFKESYILKISGLWQNEKNIGINFKLIII